MTIIMVIIVGIVCFLAGVLFTLKAVSIGISRDPEKFIAGVKNAMPKTHDQKVAEFSKGINDIAKREIDKRKADGSWSLGE